ncbi:MAG: MFS transporter [Bacillota bacterium]|nr:MFS transporter [Bacillota bacterium]NLL26499.1 MFS transporter [Erysipelotrichia bacterium]
MDYKNKKLMFSITNFLSYIAEGVGYCMLITYLISIGYTATQRSMMISFGALLSIFFQFLVGYLCDKNKTIRRYIIYSYIVYSIVVIVLYAYNTYNFYVHFVLVALNAVMFRINMGLLDSWVLESGEQCKTNYGSIRAFGSIGWVIGSWLAARVLDYLGYIYIGLVFTIIHVILIAINLKMDDVVKESQEKIDLKSVGKLFENKGYIYLILIMFGIFMMQTALDYTIVSKLDSLKATNSQISYYWMITGIVELPLFFYGGKAIKKFGAITLLVVSIISYGVRFLFYGLSVTVGQVLTISLLQATCFPIMQIVSKQLIDFESPASLKSSGQQVGLALYSSVSALIAPLITGVIEDAFSVNVALYVIGCFALFSLLFTCFYVREKKKQGLFN